MTGSNYSANTTTTTLTMGMCFLLNLPRNHLECVTTTDGNGNMQCLYCPYGATFSAGEKLDDFRGRGHVTVLIMMGCVAIIGSLGVALSCLIIAVLRKQGIRTSFDILLVTLAWFDMACCIISTASAQFIATWFQNWSRGFATLLSAYIIHKAIDPAKSGSSMITIILTVERFVGITYPFRARKLFTPFKTKLLVCAVCIYTVLNVGVRLGSLNIGKNHLDSRIKSVTGLSHLVYPSPTIQKIVILFDTVELFLSIPVLLVFNAMIFYQIRKISAERKELSCSQRKELSAARMVSPVALALVIFTLIPITAYFSVAGELPTEIIAARYSLFAVNSAVNFPIYYWNSKGFKRDAKALVKKYFTWW